jgi:predicted nucleic acid-binding protein
MWVIDNQVLQELMWVIDNQVLQELMWVIDNQVLQELMWVIDNQAGFENKLRKTYINSFPWEIDCQWLTWELTELDCQ